MFERVKRLYETGKITEAGLTNAVKIGWISAEEKEKILAGAKL